MSKKSDEYPEAGELILGTVESIFKQGAFISLDEYGDKRGMLHLSEISLKWVRNIRDYVKEGQKVVLLVLDVNPSRGHIDLSLRRVTDAQRKEKLQEVKQKQRAAKLVEIFAKDHKLTGKEAASIESVLLARFESIYSGLEMIATDNSIMDELDIPAKWKQPLLELINNSIKSSLVSVTGYVELKSFGERGVDDIRNALLTIKGHEPGSEIDVSYISAPMYRVKVTGRDYKSAEKALKNATEAGIAYIQERRGAGEFHRKLAEKVEK